MSMPLPKTRAKESRGRWAAAFLIVALVAPACARYHARPLSPAATLEDFQARRLDAPALGAFLTSHQVARQWPPAAWDLETLTLAAFYYSPQLDVARAQWDVARGGVITAGGRPNPVLTGGTGYNSTTPTSEITPWIPEALLDLPIEVAGKRGIRIAGARQLSAAARLNVLTAAWQVRSRVRQAFLDLYVARMQSDSLLARQLDIQTQIVRILELQLSVGEVSPYEVTQARIALADSRLAVLSAAQALARARSELADAVGVPPVAIDSVQFSFAGFGTVDTLLPPAEVRQRALVNRSDILGALAVYEASQRALQLEVRKQYPDIVVGPGYQLDQTDSKWTLTLSLALPLLNRNQGPIAEAEARREEAAAQFLALQSQVLGQVESSLSASRAAVAQVGAADSLLADLTRQERTAENSYRVGEISRLELLGLQSQLATTALRRLDAQSLAQQAIGQLEDAMQSPLDVSEWVLTSPRRSPGRPR